MASRARRIAGAVVLDDDPDFVDYRRGPGTRQCTPGPVDAIYAATGAWHRECTGCGAGTHEYCRWPNGRLRKTPCQPRTKETSEPHE